MRAAPTEINDWSMTMIKAWAAKAPKQKLVPYEYEPGELKADEVEIEIENCGICYSDLSIIDNVTTTISAPFFYI
jgi:D-arabinose 1-dehydrogenase-like Zn-dependent alcohol dehydrogenase